MKRQERELVGLAPREISRFIFIKIDLRWIYSGYWLALAAQSRSTYNTEERVEIESSKFFLSNATSLPRMPSRSRCNRYLRHSNFLAQKQEGTKEKKLYEWIQVRKMQFSFPLSLLHVQCQHCRHSICSSIRLFRAPITCTVSKVQGKYNIAYRYSRDPLSHCLDGGDTRRRWRSLRGVCRRDASAKRRILIWRMRKFQEDLLPRNFPQRHVTKSVKGGKRRSVTICKKKKNMPPFVSDEWQRPTTQSVAVFKERI